MALAGRHTRRGGGRRALVVGVVVTLLVLLIDASINSRSDAPVRQLAGQEWVDRVQSIIVESNTAGRDLAAFRSGTSKVTAAGVTGELAAMASGADASYKQFEAFRAPASLAAASGLLQACLIVRAQATAAIDASVKRQLRAPLGADSASAASALATEVDQLQVADQAYQLFVNNLPASLGVTVPASRWVSSAAMYTAPQLQIFLTGLRNRISLTPVHALAIEAVTTDPSSLGRSGANETLSPNHDLTVMVVVGDTGNQPEDNLTVTAAIAPSIGTSSAREFVSLKPGASQTVSIGYLNPPLGETVTLTVTVTAPPGDGAAPQTQTLTFEMPSSTSTSLPLSSTTTLPPSTSTTIPGSTTATTTAAT